MREIALDTETTGLDPKQGHRMVEIGCVEMINHMKTGKSFHAYLNPGRDMPEEAFRIHGISSDFLKDKPPFSQVADEFIAFLGDSKLVIHNAAFDMKFINYELQGLNKAAIVQSRVVDTLLMARKKFPGSPASLDALCKRFGVDLSSRTKHGALLDAELLALVYLELMGGSQARMELEIKTVVTASEASSVPLTIRPARPHAPSEVELMAHEEFLKKIKNPLWEGVN